MQGLASGAVGLGLGLGDGACVAGGAALGVYSVGVWRQGLLCLAVAFESSGGCRGTSRPRLTRVAAALSQLGKTQKQMSPRRSPSFVSRLETLRVPPDVTAAAARRRSGRLPAAAAGPRV